MRGVVKVTFALLFLLGIITEAQAEPITFDFTFQDPNGTAQAVGLVTFEENLLPNPEPCDDSGLNLPNPAVLVLQVTVNGASSGNGTFSLSAFGEIAWCTNGATLDVRAQLVGQPTPDLPWGTPSIDGEGGDFNLFGSAHAPVGENYFTLCADGGYEDCMLLTSMLAREQPVLPSPAVAPAPVLDLKGFVGVILTMLAVGATALRRRA